MQHSNGMDRRDFMKGAMLGGAGLGMAGAAQAAVPGSMSLAQAEAAPPVQKVPRKQLGNTGMTVPILLMGGSQTFDPKYDKMLHRAHSMGVDYIDTAELYAGGESHITIAPFLQQIGRKNVWITSKVALKGSKATPENYKKRIDNCLSSLQTDYLDMFFMHMIDDLEQLEPDFIKMGEDIKKSGKAKLFGFSCHDGNVARLIDKAAKVGGIDAIMFRYNFRQYGDLELNNAMDAAKKAGIGLIAMKTQSSVPDDLEKVVEFQSKSFTLAQAKLKSVWADERIDAAVSGISNLQILQENATAAMSPEKLTMNEFHQLNKLARLTRSYHCMGCKHICETKVAGELKIADALRYLMYADSYHDPETARLLYNALSPAERNFEGVDLSAATAACPQGIQIEARLRQAREMLLA
jgi:predicted aldo/keto reductase-like oxidoreductase